MSNQYNPSSVLGVCTALIYLITALIARLMLLVMTVARMSFSASSPWDHSELEARQNESLQG